MGPMKMTVIAENLEVNIGMEENEFTTQ